MGEGAKRSRGAIGVADEEGVGDDADAWFAVVVSKQRREPATKRERRGRARQAGKDMSERDEIIKRHEGKQEVSMTERALQLHKTGGASERRQ